MAFFCEAALVASESVNFTIPGEPVGKARPRITRQGITYTPAKTVNYETLVKEMYYIKNEGRLPDEDCKEGVLCLFYTKKNYSILRKNLTKI